MKWMERLKGAVRAITWSDFPQQLLLMDTANVAAGVAVTERTALTYSPFWCGVNIISSQIATLPRAVYKRVGDDERERDRSQPASKVLMRPNQNMTDVVFWETLVAHCLTWGNGYAEIEFDRALRPIGLHTITPDRVTPFTENGRLRYRVSGSKTGVMDAEDMLHVPGLGWDGCKGYSVVAMARQSLGLGLAAERFGGQFFGNGARPGIGLQHKGKLSPEAHGRLKESIRRDQGGANQLGVMILEEGMELKTYAIHPNDAQFLETREFSVEEQARWLNIQPSKLKSKVGERPGGNLEADQISFLTDTLRPWLVRIEQECNRKLFPASAQQTFYVEHNVDALLRVDNESRMAGYKALSDLGVITPEQIAKKENLPKPEEKQAPLTQRIESVGQLIRAGFDPEDASKALGLPPMKHLGVLPVTVQPEERPEPAPLMRPPGEEPEPEEPEEPEADSRRLASALRAVLVDQVARFVRRESSQAKRAAKKGPEAFAKWMDDFYGTEANVLRELILTGVELHMAHRGVNGNAANVSESLAEQYIQRSKEQLESLKAKDLERELESVMERWQTLRPVEMADAIAAMKENGHAA